MLRSPLVLLTLLGLTWLSLLEDHASQAASPKATSGLEHGLIAHWPLISDAREVVGERHAVVRGQATWNAGEPGVVLDGRGSYLEVPAEMAPKFSAGDFSLSAWVEVNETLNDVPGDILGQYDPRARRGWHVGVKTNAGVTTTQANWRQLQFCIDANLQTEWTDVGRPGNATLAFALATFDNQLFAGTCEPEQGRAGHVYRYTGEQQWVDCGTPAPCNAVTALAEFDGALYAGVGKYRFGGSALAESENAHLGGAIYRYGGDGQWTFCGQLPEVEAIGGMVVFGGRLYASSLYRPAGFFRYEGGERWTALPTPGVRVEALAIHDGYLYASSYDGGHVFRFDGQTWTDCGQLGGDDNTQTYSFAVYQGRLYVGTWRSGRVYRFEDVNRWTDVGRLGEELEVMGMLTHNGRLIAGTLPLAEVYEFDGQNEWKRLTRLDHTPDVTYRRAWTMAEFDGKLFCSTLPSGRVFASTVGASAASGTAFPSGWHHVAAIRSGGALRLWLDGQQIATRELTEGYDLNAAAPLCIGAGPNASFHGRLRGVRAYQRGLKPEEVQALAAERP